MISFKRKNKETNNELEKSNVNIDDISKLGIENDYQVLKNCSLFLNDFNDKLKKDYNKTMLILEQVDRLANLLKEKYKHFKYSDFDNMKINIEQIRIICDTINKLRVVNY